MYHAAPVNEYFRPEMTVGDGQAEVLIPVRPDFFHAAHAIHGAIYFKAMDDAAFFAVQSIVTDVFILTVSFNVYLTRPVSEGTLRCVGRVVHRSKQLFLAESELFNEEQVVGRGSGSFMRSAISLSSLGY
jgi:uncharacterized protein (TIGR00369 family)